MNKPISTALLVLVSSLTLSATALAEPSNHGSSYVNAISNAHSNSSTQSARSVPRTETMATASGFNDRGTVENETVTVNPKTAIETSISRMFSAVTSGFNERG